MGISEKASYIRGLIDGLELDQSAKETKVLTAISELLEEMCETVERLDEENDEIYNIIDEIDENLGDLEAAVYPDGCSCGHHHDEDESFEVTCPKCKETIELTDEMLSEDSIVCPNCGEKLEFDFDDDSDED